MATAQCDSPECVQALKHLQNARNKVLSLCSQLAQLRASAAGFDSLMKAMLAVATGMLAVAAAVGAVPLLGWIAAAPFLALAAVFLALAIYFATRSALINGQISDLEQQLVAAQNQFNDAVSEVMANCPPECWGDLNMPAC